MTDLNPLSIIIENFKEGREEAIRERKARQKDYKKRLVENFNYSPKEFYVLLAKAIETRRIPGLAPGLVKLFESVPGSSKRLYMTVGRERFVYYVCAAPFGTGFFFSWRLVDERQPGDWFHFFSAMAILGGLSLLWSRLFLSPILSMLNSVGYDSVSLAQIAPFIPMTFFLMQFLLLWSLMRCAAIPGYERLANVFEKIPLFGRVFERFFRPETYYRQDSEEMFKQAFENAVNEAIDSITTPQGARKRDIGDAPVVSNLHGK
jgi:hypothetical protein